MADTATAQPVKLFVATLHTDADLVEEAATQLREEWGDADFVSEDFLFTETDYYDKEMGSGLRRRFYAFSRLVSPDFLVTAKLYTNQIEQKFMVDGLRRINLDPGYIDYYKLVLGSAKFGGQKIYLREGIYADMTLLMFKGQWESFVWGFPDFKSRKYDKVLSQIRDLYKQQMK